MTDKISNYFAAVPLPEELKLALHTFCDNKKESYPFRKWVHEKDYHITLKYLGGCSLDKVEEVKAKLSQAVNNQKSFQLTVDHAGHFGRPHAPRILWAGVQGDLALLNQLQQVVEQAMSKIGFEKENRPYRPHITLAKTFRGDHFHMDQFASLWEEQWFSPSWTVDQIVLYRTDLKSKPMYVSVDKFPFS